MKSTFLIASFILISSFLVAFSPDKAAAEDEKAVRECVELYFEGARTAKPEPFEKAWDLSAGRMVYVRSQDGAQSMKSIPITDAITNWTSKPAEESWGKILSLDVIEGKMAIAKVKILFREHIYIDLLSLYKINNEWKIVNKTFVSLGRHDSAASQN